MTRTPHNGGPCPVDPGTIVKVEFRDGGGSAAVSANNWTWRHDGSGDDIIAYRVITPSPDWKAIAGELAKTLQEIQDDCWAYYPPPHGAIIYATRPALSTYTQALEQDQ